MNAEPAAAQPAEEDPPYPLDAVPLQGLIGRSEPPPASATNLSELVGKVLWLLLAADAALAGALLLVHPTTGGTWGHVVAVMTLGGRVTLTLWLALTTTAALVGVALVTRGFDRAGTAELALTIVVGLAAAVTVAGAVLMLTLVLGVGGLALFILGAVAERDSRP